MSEDGSKDFLTVDFETVSTGTLVFEVDFWSQYNNMSNGFFFMYDEDGNTVLKLSATSRTANGTYTNEYVKNGDKQLNNSAWGSGATGAVKDMRKFVVKVEVDLGAKKWRVWQNTKQLAYTADPTVNEFDFMIDSDVNISSLKWGIYGKNHGIDNIKIYKKLTASQTVKSYDMLAGDKQQAQINVSPATETIGDLKWVSSDTSVATVDGTGLITAVKEGTANITAESAFYGINYTYAVAVKTPATGLSIDKIESTVCIDDTVTLRAVPSPANTTAG
ncbi:MAG: Ig-like domain-containing protein, partial [Clostridia bacterium]|nr:Ig-like domain-containing protein [Clostridia bacterium]